jgi:LmbE family N-acetylglucosaminyl deacetylase
MMAHRPSESAPRPAGLISPHLDDVVLSCSGAITAGSLVVSVFASGPRPVTELPAWDVKCGFSPGDDVSGIRQREDDAALSLFGARGERLDYWANQYRAPSREDLVRYRRWVARLTRRKDPAPDRRLVDAVASDLGAIVDRTDVSTWYLPLGVGHPDHVITAAAVLRVAGARPERQWIVYEDLPYAQQEARLRQTAARRIAKSGYELREIDWVPRVPVEIKRSAMDRYESQLKALGSSVDLSITATEKYHLLVAAS